MVGHFPKYRGHGPIIQGSWRPQELDFSTWSLPDPLKNRVTTQNEGVMDPSLFRGRLGDSRLIYLYIKPSLGVLHPPRSLPVPLFLRLSACLDKSKLILPCSAPPSFTRSLKRISDSTVNVPRTISLLLAKRPCRLHSYGHDYSCNKIS